MILDPAAVGLERNGTFYFLCLVVDSSALQTRQYNTSASQCYSEEIVAAICFFFFSISVFLRLNYLKKI